MAMSYAYRNENKVDYPFQFWTEDVYIHVYRFSKSNRISILDVSIAEMFAIENVFGCVIECWTMLLSNTFMQNVGTFERYTRLDHAVCLLVRYTLTFFLEIKIAIHGCAWFVFNKHCFCDFEPSGLFVELWKAFASLIYSTILDMVSLNFFT